MVGLTAEPMAPTVTFLEFSLLDGWRDDDHQAALDAFRVTSGDLAGPEWAAIHEASANCRDPRAFFEERFRPDLIADGSPALVTGYYEPDFPGALSPDDTFRFPIHAPPPDLTPGQPYATRQDIEAQGLLANRGLEIAWLADPVDAFFLQVQGSGRIRLPDAALVRVGYAARNGQPYRSIGQELVERGELTAAEVSPRTIRRWIGERGAEGIALLWHNPSYVFFRRIDDIPADHGPPGTMGRPVVAGRTLAVDPRFIPLGAPVWVETEKPAFRRLMVAQDTGSAITGPQRGDIFFGTGDAAGDRAGAMKSPGRLVVLLPRTLAGPHAPQWKPVS